MTDDIMAEDEGINVHRLFLSQTGSLEMKVKNFILFLINGITALKCVISPSMHF